METVDVRDWLSDRKLPDATTRQGAFLFLVGVILNQNISGELAWRGVARLSERLDLRPQAIRGRSVADVETTLRQAPAVHPFAAGMARAVVSAADQVCREYQGDARSVWRTARTLPELNQRMTSFRQVGRHKADVAVFLLATVYAEWDTTTTPNVTESCPALLTYLGVN